MQKRNGLNEYQLTQQGRWLHQVKVGQQPEKNIKQTNSHKKTNNKQAATNKQPPKNIKKRTVL